MQVGHLVIRESVVHHPCYTWYGKFSTSIKNIGVMLPDYWGVPYPRIPRVCTYALLSKQMPCSYPIPKKIPAVSSVAKHMLSEREVWGFNLGSVKSAQCRQRLATAATFLRSCVDQALSCGHGPRHLLHASA